MPNLNEWFRQQTVLKGDEGFGDTVKRITGAVGIKPCGGCEERRKKLNRLIQYNKEKAGQ